VFKRRKILLALLDACGGELSSTDTVKLLFLYCAERGVNYYDFFPYRFGCFSFISYQDKRVLTQQGYLAELDSFKLTRKAKRATQLEAEEQRQVKDFTKRTKHLRGKTLIRHVYLSYPYFASRSEIKERILSDKERMHILRQQPVQSGKCLMTIGYEGLTIDAYINKLIEHNVALVVDVRRNPISMKYGFSKTRFSNYLERAGIAYEHIPELGIASSLRKHLKTESDYRALFRDYAATLPERNEELRKIHQLVEHHQRVALTCFEGEPTSCHRHKITERLVLEKNWSIPILHIH
jgi:uncharacterized protein (DUF488 family)